MQQKDASAELGLRPPLIHKCSIGGQPKEMGKKKIYRENPELKSFRPQIPDLHKICEG